MVTEKPADKAEPKFKVGDTIHKKDDSSNKITISSIDEYFYYANSYNIIIKIADKEWELVEQNPAWSEEDEDILNTIINHFKVDIECTDEDDVVRWLKSLKERFNK